MLHSGNWQTILNMDGYGIYVWAAYGTTLFAFAANLALGWREKLQVRKIIRQHLLETRL
jgi:heme exporter protein CcmD